MRCFGITLASPGNSIEENSNGSGGSNTGNGNSNPDSGSGSKTGSGGTNRNSGGTNSNAGSVQVQSTQGIGTAAIVAMSVGGVVLVLAAVAMRRRQLVAGDDAITGIDSLAANTTAEEAA